MTSAPDRYLFVHIQKTAGTALLRRLRHHFGPEAVYPTPAEQGSSQVVLDVERLVERVHRSGADLKVMTGHFPLATADRIGGSVATFTVLRDPVERVLSFLRHQREVDPRFSRSSLEEIYASPVARSGLVRDHMVRMLSLTSEEMTDGALTQVTIDRVRVDSAFENLAGRIDVMGLQERFDVFCQDLEGAFGWDLGEPIFMNRTRPVGASEALRQQIEADNEHDRDLYLRAVELWKRRHPTSAPV